MRRIVGSGESWHVPQRRGGKAVRISGEMNPTEGSGTRRASRRWVALAALVFSLGPGAVLADQWLVYTGGGIETIAEKGWKERRGQVLFTQRGGTLVSVPFDDVDLAASAFITWQMNGRRRMPPRTKVSGSAPSEGAETAAPCVDARVVALRGGETLEVAVGTERETIHLACLDAPETRHHRFPQIAWFGRAAVSWLEFEIQRGDRVCLTEHSPQLRDGDGHRILYVSSAEGRDYTGAVIAGGLGVLRPGPCSRAAEYSALEESAIAQGRGLWGARAEQAALAAVSHNGAVSSGPPPRRRRTGGG